MVRGVLTVGTASGVRQGEASLGVDHAKGSEQGEARHRNMPTHLRPKQDLINYCTCYDHVGVR